MPVLLLKLITLPPLLIPPINFPLVLSIAPEAVPVPAQHSTEQGIIQTTSPPTSPEAVPVPAQQHSTEQGLIETTSPPTSPWNTFFCIIY